MIAPHFGLRGRFCLGARLGDGRRRPVTEWFDNLILDSGLDLIGSSNTYLDAVQVGSSALAPDVSQTQLVSHIAGTTNRVAANSAAANVAPWQGVSQITYRFAPGAVVGLIRELAVGPGVSGPTFNRTLITNNLGEAVGVEILADEALEVEYELAVVPPQSDLTGTAIVDGVERAYTIRAAEASTTLHWAPYNAQNFAAAGQALKAEFIGTGAHLRAHDGALGSITSSPGGASANASLVDVSPYISGSLRRTARMTWDPAVANFGAGIRSLYWRMRAGSGAGANSLGAYQIEFSPPIAKHDLTSFWTDLGMSWGRA